MIVIANYRILEDTENAMSYLVICGTALLASSLSFFSGYGHADSGLVED